MQYLKIKRITPVHRRDRYDLTIASTHNFFANGILIHNTSAIFCNLLTKRNLSWKEKLAKKFGVHIKENEYTTFCSSRKVIKDPNLNPGVTQGFYDCDIWSLGLEVVKNYLIKGMSLYCEIVGYMPTGSAIQGKWDYGCVYDPKVYRYQEMSATQMYQAKLFDIIVYRITMTNVDGKVHEYSAKQVRDWCIENGLHPVSELYYGKAEDLLISMYIIIGMKTLLIN